MRFVCYTTNGFQNETLFQVDRADGKMGGVLRTLSIAYRRHRACIETSVLRLLFLLCFATVSLASDFTGIVTRVLDGDTLAVARGEYTIRIRLYGVDAPEKAQAGGAESAAFTERLALDQPATLVERAVDRYGRVVCDVMLSDGRVLNEEIVRAGHGWWYERYAPLSMELRMLEAEARSHRRGLWADLYPKAPWEWRKEEHSAPARINKRTRRSEARTQRRTR